MQEGLADAKIESLGCLQRYFQICSKNRQVDLLPLLRGLERDLKSDLFTVISPNPVVAFLGASEESAWVLKALVDNGVRIELAVTKEPKRRSRGSSARANSVEEVARAAGIEVSYDISTLKSKVFELAIVVAFGLIIPSEYIERWPFLNIHYSLLPRWRGAAPVERAILAGDESTGVALMEIVEALDAGKIYDLVEVKIDDYESSAALRSRLTNIGIERLLAALKVGGSFFADAVEQSGEVTYAKKIKKEEFQIGKDTSVSQLLRMVRVARPFGVSSEFGRVSISDCSEVSLDKDEIASTPVGVLRGDTLRLCDGAVVVGNLQVEGKRAMALNEFRRGNHKDIDFVS